MINTNYHAFNLSDNQFQAVEDSNAQVQALTAELFKDLGLPNFGVGYSKSIDATMGFATSNAAYVCPLFTVDLNLIPEKIRPTGSNDPRLCNLAFLQELADWLSQTFSLKYETMSLMHIAACKAILKIRENPKTARLAMRAGLAHEIGHVMLKHQLKLREMRSSIAQKYPGRWNSLNPRKLLDLWKFQAAYKRFELEADQFAASHLNQGLEGIVAGFTAWQDALKDLRKNSNLNWRSRLLLKATVSPKGNPLALYFSHGTFDSRIKKLQLPKGR